ncbi:hypothetical protein I552_4021 [Mycobacterium xenopi 3993]|nr:hypothetical protein I552_4021 [Mycobacterium xenopi 3993]
MQPDNDAVANDRLKHTVGLCKTVRYPHRRALIHGLPPPAGARACHQRRQRGSR